MKHLRVFGCTGYVMVKPEDRTKLDPKSKKCVFVGYGTEEFGYRMYDFATRRIIRSRDVVFREDMVYKNWFESPTTSAAEIEEESDEDELVWPEHQSEQPDKEQPLFDVPDTDAEIEQSDEEDEEPPQPTTPSPPPLQQIPAVRRSTRPAKPNPMYAHSLHYLLLIDGGEPESVNEAQQVDSALQWESAMKEEMESLKKNQTWDLVRLPAEKKALHNKWVYRIKKERNGNLRYKARLVVKGFEQRAGIDFTEIFSPVVILMTIRAVLSIVAVENLQLEQMEVKTAFLYGELNEEIYM